MCGIAGLMNIKQDVTRYKSVMANMINILHHRGPDGFSIWGTNHLLLGHSRLIVIDPYTGSQPMVITKNENTYVITYNGELYNTQDIRYELQQKNYSFRGTSDTEVLLNSYIEWGYNCLEKLNGIFSFAIWDTNRNKLFLARDRFGVKPLFYFWDGESFVFASELKSILQYPDAKPIIDKTSLSDILFLGPSRTPGCGIFKNVSELKPAHCLVFDGEKIDVTQYWKLKSKKHTDTFAETVEKVRFLFKDAVKRQLVSDVPLCTFLSGGLDSSAISAIAAKHYKENNTKLHTYSINFTNNEKYFKAGKFQSSIDDKWINIVSKHSDTIHHKITLDIYEQIDALEDAMVARDLPGMADIDSSMLLFCREIKKDFVVSLSGECADEIFGGYPWFFREDVLTLQEFPWIKQNSDKIQVLSPDLLEMLNPSEYLNMRYHETLDSMPKLEGEDYISSKRRQMFYLKYLGGFYCLSTKNKLRHIS